MSALGASGSTTNSTAASVRSAHRFEIVAEALAQALEDERRDSRQLLREEVGALRTELAEVSPIVGEVTPGHRQRACPSCRFPAVAVGPASELTFEVGFRR